MKIAFLAAAKSIHTARWVNALAQKGHTVRLYSLPDHADTQKKIDSRVKTIPLKVPGFAGYFFNAGCLKKELAQFRPDLVNAHYASGYGTLARLCGVHPLLLSVWGSDVYLFPAKGPLYRHLVRKNLAAADAVASTGYAMARQVRLLLPGCRKIFITPFGVDCSRFAPEHKAEDKCFTVGAVKALEPPYGMDDLIRAFALLREKMPEGRPVKLEIYGEGSLRGSLQALIGSLGLEKCAFLRGAVPNTEVPSILNRMDAVCLPSIEESFGVSAVEAMACGVPVVASDADGFRETMEDGVTGFLVPRHDPQAAAEKLLELAQHPELRESLGKSGRKRVLELYDFQKNVESMEQAYRETIRIFKGK
jgi:glycosyltransferase involved in cell wall biosynthesis